LFSSSTLDNNELACVDWIQCEEEWSRLGWRNEFGSLFQRLDWSS